MQCSRVVILRRNGLSVLRRSDTKKSHFFQQIHKILGLISPIPELQLLTIASTPASPDFTRDYGIKCEISCRYRFLRETSIPESVFLERIMELLGLG